MGAKHSVEKKHEMITPIQILQQYLDGIETVTRKKDLPHEHADEIERQRWMFLSTIQHLNLWQIPDSKLK